MIIAGLIVLMFICSMLCMMFFMGAWVGAIDNGPIVLILGCTVLASGFGCAAIWCFVQLGVVQ